MALVPSLLVAALVAQSPAADSLRLLALRGPELALVLETRERPLVVREALTEALARAVRVSATAREDELTAARRLAAAYGMAWNDSFLIREVARFAAWPPGRRSAKVAADSVRRAGSAAFGRVGAVAAIAIWRRALSRAMAMHGGTLNPSETGDEVPVDETWIYSVARNRWTQVFPEDPPGPHAWHVLSGTEGSVMLFGGGDSRVTWTNDTYL